MAFNQTSNAGAGSVFAKKTSAIPQTNNISIAGQVPVPTSNATIVNNTLSASNANSTQIVDTYDSASLKRMSQVSGINIKNDKDYWNAQAAIANRAHNPSDDAIITQYMKNMKGATKSGKDEKGIWVENDSGTKVYYEDIALADQQKAINAAKAKQARREKMKGLCAKNVTIANNCSMCTYINGGCTTDDANDLARQLQAANDGASFNSLFKDALNMLDDTMLGSMLNCVAGLAGTVGPFLQIATSVLSSAGRIGGFTSVTNKMGGMGRVSDATNKLGRLAGNARTHSADNIAGINGMMIASGTSPVKEMGSSSSRLGSGALDMMKMDKLTKNNTSFASAFVNKNSVNMTKKAFASKTVETATKAKAKV